MSTIVLTGNVTWEQLIGIFSQCHQKSKESVIKWRDRKTLSCDIHKQTSGSAITIIQKFFFNVDVQLKTLVQNARSC